MIRRPPFLLVTIVTASALMLWCSPARAADDVTVMQSGDDGQVEIAQSADGGSVVVQQAALSAHARAVVDQSGTDGTIVLFQGGTGAGTVPDGGPVAGTEGNYADLTQTGDGTLTVYQGVETPIGSDEPAVSVAGTFANSIVFVQGDGNNVSTLTQIGPDNVIIGS
ncbi:MAG: hypothetical protein QF652_07550, partial [Dehalococcoidia bacterium]|nr:hypothetical protein [Dehalococcoidia bacterium]